MQRSFGLQSTPFRLEELRKALKRLRLHCVLITSLSACEDPERASRGENSPRSGPRRHFSWVDGQRTQEDPPIGAPPQAYS